MYDEKIVYEIEKFREQNEKLHDEYDTICETFGIMNVYSQLFILDKDIQRAGVHYEKI